jgi:methionyl-tRNA formyltransferase
MRIVFLGTPEFAVATLDAILNAGFEVAAVVTAPDKPAGRGQKMQESAVKRHALMNGLPVFQPVNLKDPDFIAALKNVGADINVVVAFRMLPEAVWNMPRLGTYNLHASLLPAYRGAAPINWVLIKGESETGVTTFKLRHQIDTGNILLQESMALDESINAGELHDALMRMGAGLMTQSLGKIIQCDRNGLPLPLKPQAQVAASHAPKLDLTVCRINWHQDVRDIHNLVRGLSPYPGAFCYLVDGGRKMHFKILRTSYVRSEHSFTNGSLLTPFNDGLFVHAFGGLLRLEEVQMEGKKRMKAEEFLRGYRIGDTAHLE